MERGVLLEQEARDYYQFQTDNEVKQVGLVYKDETKMISCSPDGLMDKSGLEIKCPAPHTHIKYLLAGKLPSEYVPQVQGSIWITGADSWDFVSYHPDIEPMLIHVERDDEYIEKLESEINKFVSKLIKQRERLIEIGVAA